MMSRRGKRKRAKLKPTTEAERAAPIALPVAINVLFTKNLAKGKDGKRRLEMMPFEPFRPPLRRKQIDLRRRHDRGAQHPIKRDGKYNAPQNDRTVKEVSIDTFSYFAVAVSLDWPNSCSRLNRGCHARSSCLRGCWVSRLDSLVMHPGRRAPQSQNDENEYNDK